MKQILLFCLLIFFAAAISVTAGVIGDVDGDWDVDLSDVISTMKILTNTSDQTDINLTNDVNSDNVWGLPEAVYDLSYLAGLRDLTLSSTVQTSYGTISGIGDGNSLYWLGIPYAAPPVDDLRWKEPQDPSPWQNTREAANFSSKCTQFFNHDRNNATPPILSGNEDCLYLNISRPANLEKSLPVYFYVHGGVNSIGTGNAGPYNGTNLALSGNMIVVTINYRLGPFGWFNLPQLNIGNQATDSGNFGLLDTIQALKWVKENIASFGGDPGNITIAGQSAGGQDILALLLSPFASNLFHKAIVRSGIQPYKSMSDAENHARGRLKQIMVNDSNPPFDVITTLAEATTYLSNNPEFDVAGYMRAKSNTEIMVAYEATYPDQTYTFVKDNGSLRMPTVLLDGNVIPTTGYDAFGDGTYFNKVPIILGSNLDEIKYALAFDPYFNNDPLAELELYNAVAAYGSDLWKFNAVDDLAQKITSLTEPPAVYAYQFKWQGINDINTWFPDKFGACHSSEVPFFFGNEIGGYAGISFTEDNRQGREALSAAIISYISRFVHTGTPDSGLDSDLPAWEPWTDGVSNPKVLLLDANKTQTIISTSTSVLTRESVLASMPDTTPSIRSFLEIQYPAFWLTSPTGFTAEMLDAGSTYYTTRSGDPDGTTNLGTTQEILVFSGTGPDYVLTITEEYFDESNVSQGTNTFDVDITLNPDGTLTATVSGDPDSTAITLTSETATYLLLHGVIGDIGDGNTWDDTWYFAQPAGWLTSPTGFTAEMLDASPTYYSTNTGDPEGTTQEIYVFSGTGPYVLTITEEYFDASDVSQGTGTLAHNVTLNPDGTLTVTESGESGETIVTLTAETATYLYVNGVEVGTETWDDYWFFVKPPGWLDQLDFDNDGDSYSENQGDCDDTDDMVNPDALDFCGDGIDQDCNGSDLACLPPEFYGGWQLYDNSADEFISFTIFNDGVYMYGEKDDSGTENGVEVGTLGINPATDIITVHTVYDQASSGGIDHTPNNTPSDHTMTVSGNTLTFTEPGNPDSPFILTRVTDTSEPLIGSWHFGSAGHKEDIINSMTAYDNNTYIYCEYNIKTPQDSGVEFGTYAYANGEIILTMVVDQNGDAGTSGISGLTLPLVINGDVMTLTMPDEGEAVFYRVQ